MIEEKLLRDTYLEVNLDSLEYNIKEIKKLIGSDVEISAVVKSNAYGFGAVGIASTLVGCGVKYLAVANLLEAVELKNQNSNYPVFIMGHTPDSMMQTVVNKNITATVFSFNQAKILSDLSKTKNKITPLHIKYDTGFNRLGFKHSKESMREIEKIFELENIEVEGIFSHLALTSYNDDLEQFEKLLKLKTFLNKKGLSPKYYHICDSISGMDYENFRLDMIRPGAAIYGLKSFKNKKIKLKSIGTFKSKISSIKKISPGEGVSYDYTWKASKDTTIATVPFGYGDGYPRNMFKKGHVTISGIKCPIIGVLCMDQCIVDVSSIENPKVGQDVIIWSNGENNTISVQELSELAKTNKNEIVSRTTRRVPRVYIKDNKVYNILNYLLN